MKFLLWPPYAHRTTLPGLRPLAVDHGRNAGPEFGLVRREDGPADPPTRELTSWLHDIADRSDQADGGTEP